MMIYYYIYYLSLLLQIHKLSLLFEFISSVKNYLFLIEQLQDRNFKIQYQVKDVDVTDFKTNSFFNDWYVSKALSNIIGILFPQ